MTTITIPKIKYEVLKKRAALYQALLRALPERKWGIEEYTKERIREFLDQDTLNAKTRLRLKKILKSPR